MTKGGKKHISWSQEYHGKHLNKTKRAQKHSDVQSQWKDQIKKKQCLTKRNHNRKSKAFSRHTAQVETWQDFGRTVAIFWNIVFSEMTLGLVWILSSCRCNLWTVIKSDLLSCFMKYQTCADFSCFVLFFSACGRVFFFFCFLFWFHFELISFTKETFQKWSAQHLQFSFSTAGRHEALTSFFRRMLQVFVSFPLTSEWFFWKQKGK